MRRAEVFALVFAGRRAAVAEHEDDRAHGEPDRGDDDPMGVVQADLGPFPSVRVAEVDLSLIEKVRKTLPSLAHRRPDLLP